MTQGAGGGNAAPPTADDAPDSPPSRSWSQLNSYRKCGKAYELERILRVPSRPGVWLAAGTAVHSGIEQYLWQRLEASHD